MGHLNVGGMDEVSLCCKTPYLWKERKIDLRHMNCYIVCGLELDRVVCEEKEPERQKGAG